MIGERGELVVRQFRAVGIPGAWRQPTRVAQERDGVFAGQSQAGVPLDLAGMEVRVQPEAVVYVACDPVALARDVATFAEVGYTLRSVTAYDLFPNSHHVEAVAVLSR